MLDLDFIRCHADRVRRAIAQKGVELDLDELLSLDANLRSARSCLDALRAEKNSLSEGYAALPIESPVGDEMIDLYRTIDTRLEGRDSQIIQFMGIRGGEGTSTVARDFARVAAIGSGGAYAKSAADPTGHYSRPDVARLLFNAAPTSRTPWVQRPQSFEETV